MKSIASACLAAAAAIATLGAQESGFYRFEMWQAGAGLPVQDRIVTGAPYSGQYISEHVETLSDGNRIVRRTTGRVFRDSEGRVRRETDRPKGEPLVTITDPVAKTSVMLDPDTRTARTTPNLFVMELKQRIDVLREIPARGAGAGSSTPMAGSGGGRGGGGGARGAGNGRARDAATRTEEKLADKSIEGLAATGIRRVTTTPQGAIGNERPIQVVSEEWTSPELQVLLMTDLNDPRTGRSTYRLFAISRSNPPRYFFEIPADYTIIKQPSPDWVYKEMR
jgi:hypothetical protein